MRFLKVITLITLNLFLLTFLFEQAFPVETLDHQTEKAENYVTEKDLPMPKKPFHHDGCTMFPDMIPAHNFVQACYNHDIAYWAGGSEELRREADLEFKDAIAHTGPLGKPLGLLMFHGVRIFGDSFLTKWTGTNWGYGWN